MAVKKLAYSFAVSESISVPESWTRDEAAGPDWFASFTKQNPHLSIRHVESSFAIAIILNRANVNLFFDKLAAAIDRHKLTSSEIWNVDETEKNNCSTA